MDVGGGERKLQEKKFKDMEPEHQGGEMGSFLVCDVKNPW